MNVLPLAVYDPTAEFLMTTNGGLPQSQDSEISNISATAEQEELSSQKDKSPPTEQLLIPTEGGGIRFLAKDKWPKLMVQDELENKTTDKLMMMSSQESLGMGEVDTDEDEDLEEDEVDTDEDEDFEEVEHEDFKVSEDDGDDDEDEEVDY